MTTLRPVTILGVVCVLAWGFEAAYGAGKAGGGSSKATASDADQIVRIAFEAPDYTRLRGPDARRQLVVTGITAGGRELDLTRAVRYETEPEGVVTVGEYGLVTPRDDGKAAVTAVFEREGTQPLRARIELTVERFHDDVAVHFPNQIVPIFTKHGCNGGGCHGKSGGQNGFALSLLGFYPEEDHEYLVKEAFGRRVNPAAPDLSLLLLKATNTIPHGGGQRFDRDSYEYRLLRRWMLQGMPYGDPNAPHVVRIEVVPNERILGRDAAQQLSVFAHYSDGSVEDATQMAQYESNETELAEVSEQGLVTTHDLAGDAAVMVRYQGQVGVFRATIPLGVEIAKLPPARTFIDEIVFKKLKKLGLPPSEICDDATFIRRVTIDIAGRLPRADEVRAFLSSEDPAKRDKLIDRLLASTDYADYFANKWSAILRNKRKNQNYTRGTFAFHAWIRDSLHRNVPYDEFVRAIIAASGDVTQHPPVMWYRAVSSTTEQVEDAAQLFLGLRIQCARCHHHPFERWSQRDYYGFAAFFSRVGRKPSLNGLNPNDEPRIFHKIGRASAKNPRTGENLKPTPLGGEPLDIPPERDPRLELAAWLRSPDNPFFARALVNRYWKHFFGRGLVEPEDDIRVTNPATNPELLDRLAKHFIESGFDMKDLIRTICRSTVYQLSAIPNEYNVKDRQNYSRFFPKRLPAEVLYDALNQVTGSPTRFSGLPPSMRAVQLPDTGVNNYFLTVFGRPMADSACECERSQEANLAQSLHLLNSREIQAKLSDANGRAARLARDKTRADKAKIEELYLWAFARKPDKDELAVALGHVQKSEKKQQAYEDIIWALVNTKEFLFNH